MPLTPYHFGPHACVGLPLCRHLDLPVFIGANVMVDVEPVLVVLLRLEHPLHGYAHTLLVGSFVGLAWATAAFPLRSAIGRAMRPARLPYEPTYLKMALSGAFGVWLHVLFDSFLYRDIRPFFPVDANPLLGRLSRGAVYGISEVAFLPALALYVYVAFVRRRSEAATCPAGGAGAGGGPAASGG